MNVFVREIGEGDLPEEPDFDASKLSVEDNIGESIHIHVRNTRLEFSVSDFIQFANCVDVAARRLEDGDY